MCFAILKTKGGQIDKSIMTSAERALKTKYSLVKSGDCLLMHWRSPLDGYDTSDRKQPLDCANGISLAHVGTMDLTPLCFFGADLVECSDTMFFIRYVLNPIIEAGLYDSVVFDNTVRLALNGGIMIFLRHGKFKIYGEERGLWKNDCFYSGPIFTTPLPILKRDTLKCQN